MKRCTLKDAKFILTKLSNSTIEKNYQGSGYYYTKPGMVVPSLVDGATLVALAKTKVSAIADDWILATEEHLGISRTQAFTLFAEAIDGYPNIQEWFIRWAQPFVNGSLSD